MNTLQFLDRQSARRAAVRDARVVSRNPDGTYQVSDIATGDQRRVSRANPNEEYVPGSWVRVGSTNATGATIGSMDMILSRAPNEQRGTSATTPDNTTTTIDAPAIFEVVPSPIDLNPTTGGGGSAPVGSQAVASIHGSGFLVTLPTYSGFHGDGVTTYDDVEQEWDAVPGDMPPTITPEKIDINIWANGGPGYHDIMVGSAKAPNAVRVFGAITVVLNAGVLVAGGDALSAIVSSPFGCFDASSIPSFYDSDGNTDGVVNAAPPVIHPNLITLNLQATLWAKHGSGYYLLLPDGRFGLLALYPSQIDDAPLVISPNPIVLVHGGAAVAATIIGSGFGAWLTAGPWPRTDAGLPVPTPGGVPVISLASASVFTRPSRIDISLQATAACAPGSYALDIYGYGIGDSGFVAGAIIVT